MATLTPLEECLELLYEYLGNFRVLIDLVQKLAQQLKLETFVDKQGIDLPQVAAVKATEVKTVKLTIAGTTIMIDIDFSSDRQVANVVLSLANQSENTCKPDTHTLDFMTRSESDITIDWSKNELSFLKQVDNDQQVTIAESIIKSNLMGDRLGFFPENLKFLANIDQLLLPNCDLFIYLERMALILRALESVEEASEPWLLPYVSAVGRSQLNSTDTKQLGLFIDYWQDNRYINHLSGGSSPVRYLMVSIVPTNGPQHDYLNEAKTWTLTKGEFSLNFESTSSTAASSWVLKVKLSHPCYMPQSILDFHGWAYESASQKKSKSDKLYALLNQGSVSLAKGQIAYSIRSLPHLGKWVLVDLIIPSKFNDITKIILSLRNLSILTNVLVESYVTLSKPQVIPARRRSRGSIMGEDMSEETKKKLRDSLQLPPDVTDDELLGLNAMNDLSTLRSVDMSADIAVDDFLNDTSSSQENAEKLDVFIEDIDFILPFGDIMTNISGNFGPHVIRKHFRISNGVFSTESSEADMEVDSLSLEERLAKGLNVTEDLWQTLEHVYIKLE